MSLGHCSCPDCGTTLRIRDRSFVGRTVPCPECHTALVIELDPDQHVVARKPVVDKAAINKSAPLTKASSSGISVVSNSDLSTTNSRRAPSQWSESMRRVSNSPLVMAWALAIAMTALVFVAMTRPSVRFRPPSQVPPGQSRPPESTNDQPLVPDESHPRQSSPEGDPNGNAPVETPSSSELPLSIAADATRPANAPELTFSPISEMTENGNTGHKPPVVVPSPNRVQPVAAPPPKIDFDAALQQRLSEFEQPVPASRRALIEFIEELLGAPIRYRGEDLGEQNLDKLVTVRKLENTTLRVVLKAVLDPAGWEFVTTDTELRIQLKATGDAPPKP